MVAESLVPLKHLRSRLLKPHNSRQQVGGLDTGSIGDKATVVTAFISPAAEPLAEKLEPSGRSGGSATEYGISLRNLSRRSPTIFSAAMENRCSSFILSRFSGCILKLILRTMLTTSSGTVVGGVGFLGNRLS